MKPNKEDIKNADLKVFFFPVILSIIKKLNSLQEKAKNVSGIDLNRSLNDKSIGRMLVRHPLGKRKIVITNRGKVI